MLAVRLPRTPQQRRGRSFPRGGGPPQAFRTSKAQGAVEAVATRFATPVSETPWGSSRKAAGVPKAVHVGRGSGNLREKRPAGVRTDHPRHSPPFCLHPREET
jgi:hypothetical protein